MILERGSLGQRLQKNLGQLLSKRASNFIFLGMGVLYVIAFSVLPLLKHESFHTGLLLAIYENDLWHILIGQPFTNSIVDSTTLWNNYFDPLLFAFVPFYSLAPDGRTLLLIQTFAIAFAAFPIYWYARQELGTGLALIVALAFFLSPVVEYVNLDDFNIVSLSTPIISLGLFFLLRRRYAPFLITVLLAWMVKEEISLIIIGLGLFLLIYFRQYVRGIALAAFGLASLFLILNYITPLLTGKPYFLGREYFENYGHGIAEILITVLTRPQMVWAVVTATPKLEFLTVLFAPLAFLPMAGAPVLLVSFPLLLGLLLTNPNIAVLESHYAASIIPSLYFATIIGVHWLSQQTQRLNRIEPPGKTFAVRAALGSIIAVSIVTSYYLIGPALFGQNYAAERYALNAHTRAGHELFSQVPQSAVVAAQEELITHFSNRDKAFVFPGIPDYRQTDYLALEKNRFFYNFHYATIENWMATGYFQIVGEADGFVLAQRKSPDHPVNLQFGDGMLLESYALSSKKGSKNIETLYLATQWRALKPLYTRLKIVVQVVDAAGHVWASVDQEPNGGFSPATDWTVANPIGDQYALQLPPTIPPGEYHLNISVHQIDSDDNLAIRDHQGNLVGTEFSLTTARIEKNKSSFAVSELAVEQPLYADLRELRLLGFVPPRQTLAPGDLFQIGIYWRARAQPQTNYRVAIQLRDANGRVAVEQQSEPAKGAYPATQWSAGEVLLDWHDWSLPTNLEKGDYKIYLVLRDGVSGSALESMMLTTVSVVP